MTPSAVHSDAIPPVSGFGSLPSEFAELVSGSGLLDLSTRAKLALTGSDRVRWLNGMVTNNIRDLAAGTRRVRFSAQSAGTHPGRLVRLQSRRVIAGRYRSVAAGKTPRGLRQVHHHGRRRSREPQRPFASIGIAGPKARAGNARRGACSFRRSSLCNLSRRLGKVWP